MEIWKDVDGFEGLYKVSSLGSVMSYDMPVRRGSGIFLQKGRILKPAKDPDGYLLVNLYKDRKVKCGKVHRLVAIAFIPNPENKPEVNHKKGVKSDNRVSELEWSTVAENHTHAHVIGLIKKKKRRVVAQLNMDGTLVSTYESTYDAANKLSMSCGNISLAARGIFKQYNGFLWTYL